MERTPHRQQPVNGVTVMPRAVRRRAVGGQLRRDGRYGRGLRVIPAIAPEAAGHLGV